MFPILAHLLCRGKFLYSNWSSSFRVSSFKKEAEIAEIKIVLNLYERGKFYLYPRELADREKRKIVNIIKKEIKAASSDIWYDTDTI